MEFSLCNSSAELIYLSGAKKMESSNSKAKKLAEVIRVNHAGEYGAKQIYRGQLSVLKNKKEQDLLKHMQEQEQQHLDFFTEEMLSNRVRPSLFMPIWHVAGFALGIGTALLGKNAAMIATEAVEEVIDKHYQEQIKDQSLPNYLTDKIEQFRQEEVEHQEIARDNINHQNIGHKLLYNLIKIGCKASIAIAKKI
jgi:3-demethoxyubiquinol 3-hydroxylase